MGDNYINDLLIKCDLSRVERHSDSSDFESSCNSPVIAPKYGNHSLLDHKPGNTKREKEIVNQRLCENYQLYKIDTQYKKNPAKLKLSRRKTRDKSINTETKYDRIVNRHVKNSNRNRGDHIATHQLEQPRAFGRNKIMPCLSTILKRSSNFNKDCIKKVTEEKTEIIDNNFAGKAYCANCERHRIKKFNKQQRVQPVYAVEENRKTFPFQTPRDQMPVSLYSAIEKDNSDFSFDYSLSSSSEMEIVKTHKTKKMLLKQIISRLDKQIRKEYAFTGTIKHHLQQYPSKSQLKSPFQVITSSSCQTKCASSDPEIKIPTSSSSFWEFLLQKLKCQIIKSETAKDKKDSKSPEPCTPDSCEFFKAEQEVKKRFENLEILPQCCEQGNGLPKSNSCCVQAQLSSNESDTKSQESAVVCKCHPKKKQTFKSKNKQSISQQQQEDSKPCQEKHDEVTKVIADKYNGEILCIHNPPCVLINGCLNLPPPKPTLTGQGNFWPVTQSKKSSFAQMCRKIKRPKLKSTEQAIQYHPPSIDLQEYLPEFKTEKNVQSMCNHTPPCDIVHGCCKTKYNPTLQNSCIHVPMCPKLPECLIDTRNIDLDNRTCNHSPRCLELPLCTRKYIVLTAKENMATQVKPKNKMACRHRPPCLMIPKCLAQFICSDYFPGCAIPGCVHEPSCEMIPACCRKPATEMVSVPSQYPNASCRIV